MAFAIPVMSHMQDDNEDSLVAMVEHYTGISCLKAQIISIDKHGMDVSANIESSHIMVTSLYVSSETRENLQTQKDSTTVEGVGGIFERDQIRTWFCLGKSPTIRVFPDK